MNGSVNEEDVVMLLNVKSICCPTSFSLLNLELFDSEPSWYQAKTTLTVYNIFKTDQLFNTIRYTFDRTTWKRQVHASQAHPNDPAFSRPQ